jgi:hypothetical protein
MARSLSASLSPNPCKLKRDAAYFSLNARTIELKHSSERVSAHLDAASVGDYLSGDSS